LGEDSQEPEQSPKRTPQKRHLRKVATDDLDFGVHVDQDEVPSGRPKTESLEATETYGPAMASEGPVAASVLLKALMASPVNPRIKTKAKVVQKKPGMTKARKGQKRKTKVKSKLVALEEDNKEAKEEQEEPVEEKNKTTMKREDMVMPLAKRKRVAKGQGCFG
jgi:hypothetical protein